MVLECLESSECCSTSNYFVGEFGLIWLTVVTVDLLRGLLRLICHRQKELKGIVFAGSEGRNSPQPNIVFAR
jgi:hypothetical protein